MNAGDDGRVVEAFIRAIAYYLPTTRSTAADLAAEYPGWSVEKIEAKTGIASRHIAAPDECSSDLGVAAALKLLSASACGPADIDFVLFCTQSPDYFLPTTACLIQDRLGIPTTAGALDFNLGCSGYIYGLGLAKGLIETKQAQRVLLITAETYSKFMHQGDRSVRTIFGDAAAATLVEGRSTQGAEPAAIGPFVYGTDGKGGENLIVPVGGLRRARTPETSRATADESGNVRSAENLFMDGPEIFNFTLRVVPQVVNDTLMRANTTLEEIDLFIFHQANQYMLDHLRKRLKLPAEKFFVFFRECGNTVSSTIPIALSHAVASGRLKSGDRVMLVGFGVGYSWGATLVRWV